MKKIKYSMMVTVMAFLVLLCSCGTSSYLQTRTSAESPDESEMADEPLAGEGMTDSDGDTGKAASADGNTADGVSGIAGEGMTDSDGDSGKTSGGSRDKNDADAENLIYVQIAGAVAKPDVYGLPYGSRIYEAVELAGGFLPEAYDGYLNLALPLADGQKIYVPTNAEKEAVDEASDGGISGGTVGGMSGGTAGEADDGKININTAGEAELMTLPGIGQSKAALIIRYRQEHGSFSSIEEIKNIEGIKEGTFNKIRENITI